jgi:hypothetical protein
MAVAESVVLSPSIPPSLFVIDLYISAFESMLTSSDWKIFHVNFMLLLKI